MKNKRTFFIVLTVTAFVLAACALSPALTKSLPAATPPQTAPAETPTGNNSPTAGPFLNSSATPPAGMIPTLAIIPQGEVVFTLNKQLYRISAQKDSQPENISTALDKLSPGADDWINISADGQWLLISSERFDPECKGWACLTIVSADLTHTEVLKSGGAALHAVFSAVGPTCVVYVASGGPHGQDLWIIKRQAGGWSDPKLLTAASTYPNNIIPLLSADEQKVLFTCSNDAYAASDSGVCEVGADGSGYRMLVNGGMHTTSNSTVNLRHAAYAADGSVVFEGDWQGEQVWRMVPGGAPALINANLHNDNSPCALPGGWVASLWLERPGGSSLHELKIMSLDGKEYWVLMQNQDISDIGIGCGK
jgi:hypothetical protein